MKKELGQIFKEERMKRGLSITELAKFSGVDPKTISMIERGIRKKPNSNTLFKLYEVLDLPLTHAELYYLAGYNKREIKKEIEKYEDNLRLMTEDEKLIFEEMFIYQTTDFDIEEKTGWSKKRILHVKKSFVIKFALSMGVDFEN